MRTLRKRTMKINVLISTNYDIIILFVLMNFSENYKHKNGEDSREEA